MTRRIESKAARAAWIMALLAALAAWAVWKALLGAAEASPPIWDDSIFEMKQWSGWLETLTSAKAFEYPIGRFFVRPLAEVSLAWTFSMEDPIRAGRLFGQGAYLAWILACAAVLVQALPKTGGGRSEGSIDRGRLGLLAAAVAWCAWHPGGVPSGVWLAARADVMAAAFIVAAVSCSARGGSGALAWIGAVGFSIAAALSKDTAGVQLALLAPSAFALAGRSGALRLTAGAAAGMAALAACKSAAGVGSLPFADNWTNANILYSNSELAWYALQTVGQYVQSLALPWIDATPYHVAGLAWEPWPLVRDGLAAAALAGAAAAGFWKRGAWLHLASVSMSVGMLAFAQGTQRMTWDNTAIERYLLPALPFAAAAWMAALSKLSDLAKASAMELLPKMIPAAALLAAAALVPVSAGVARTWSSPIVFWGHAAERAPDSRYVHAQNLFQLLLFTSKIENGVIVEMREPSPALRGLIEKALSDSRLTAENLSDTALKNGVVDFVMTSDDFFVYTRSMALTLLGRHEEARLWLIGLDEKGARLPQMYLRLAWIAAIDGRCEKARELTDYWAGLSKERFSRMKEQLEVANMEAPRLRQAIEECHK